MKADGRKDDVRCIFNKGMGKGMAVQRHIPARLMEYGADGSIRHTACPDARYYFRAAGDQRQKAAAAYQPDLCGGDPEYPYFAADLFPVGIITTGILALGVYSGAYMAEVVRAGIEAIPKGQFEAAQSQGFNYLEKMYYIILPQSIKIILPPMVNQVVNLIKNTSCLYIIGGADLISLTYSFVTGVNTGGAYAPAYLVSGFLFFIICFPLSKIASTWELALKRREQRVEFTRTGNGGSEVTANE